MQTVAALYTPIYDKMAMEAYKISEPVYRQIFNVIAWGKRNYETNSLSGLSTWDDVAKGGLIPTEDPQSLYAQEIIPKKIGKALTIDKEDVDDDEYALLKREPVAAKMGAAAQRTIDIACAAVFNNAFTGGKDVCPDGEHLCSADHPTSPTDSTTLSNYITYAFSHDALEYAENYFSANLKDSNGEKIDDYPTVVLHASNIKGVVQRTLNDRAALRPGTMENDINRFAGAYKSIEWKRLTDNYWFLVTPKMGLDVIMRKTPYFSYWFDNAHKRHVWDGLCRYKEGVEDWRGVPIGSPGSGGAAPAVD